MLPKVLEIERHQLADYARVDYAITKGEDEIAALEELWLGLGPLRPAGQKDCTRPQLFQCGNFVFALRDRVINAGVIGQLVSLNLKHFW